MQLRRGVFPHPDIKLLGLDHPLFRGRTPVLQFVRSKREMNRLLFPLHASDGLAAQHSLSYFAFGGSGGAAGFANFASSTGAFSFTSLT